MIQFILGLMAGTMLGVFFMALLIGSREQECFPRCQHCKHYDIDLNLCKLHNIYFWQEYKFCSKYESEDKP